MYRQHHEVEGMQLADTDDSHFLASYPIDMPSFFTPPHCTFDALGIPYDGDPPVYHPNTIAQYALALWNQYLANKDEHHHKTFLAQAYWFVTHETGIGSDAGGWPITLSHPDVYTEGPCLSALTQGHAISVLVRAYQLTHQEAFLEVACRAVRTFQRDILDGGVSAPLGEEGVFFEEVAVYPASHMLSGFIFALFGLYDYIALTNDASTKHLIHRSHTTMHSLLVEFDAGFWTRSNLLHRQLASSSEIALQVALLEALARYSGCDLCSTLALRWKHYQQLFSAHLRYLIISRCTSFTSTLLSRIRSMLFPKSRVSPMLRVCVPITGFPITGGMHTILAKMAEVTAGLWQMEYLTWLVGPNPEKLAIHRFGTRRTTPREFPNIWLYVFAGLGKLISLMRHGASYDVILPQDGIFTAAFAAPVARIAGVRSVCIDHGNLGLLRSRIYRAERIHALATRRWPYRLLARLRYALYWPCLYLLAWFSAHFVDHYFVPGVTGDGVEEICKRLGVHPSRITRFANMIDIDRHVILDALSKSAIREKHGIAIDAIVLVMICRLTSDKGLEIALEAISQALYALPPNLSARVRVIIAGDGPLRRKIEEDICSRGLSQTCFLWGEASAEEVILLLGLSDIFLYTSWRAAGYPLAILEAMASGCAVIASTEPLANKYMLAEGRGITIPIGNAEQAGRALVQLVSDQELRCQMGRLARDYVAVQHSADSFRRALSRVTYWSGLDALLQVGMESERCQ